MHQPNDDEENNEFKPYYFPINFDFQVWNEWLSDIVDDIVEEKENVWVVGGNKGKNLDFSNKLIFFGKNKYNEEIWKIKYFIKDELHIFYRNHFISHAKHILEQPRHYKGMFEILN